MSEKDSEAHYVICDQNEAYNIGADEDVTSIRVKFLEC